MTKITANPMPTALDIFLDTPRKGQMPWYCESTMLLEMTAENMTATMETAAPAAPISTNIS